MDYFKSQAQSKTTRNTASDAISPIGGGVGRYSENTTLTRLGKVKHQADNRRNDIVKVELTSPVEATVEQAKDKLKNIKEHKSADNSISRLGVKRKTSRKQKSSKGKKKRSRKYKDIFSK